MKYSEWSQDHIHPGKPMDITGDITFSGGDITFSGPRKKKIDRILEMASKQFGSGYWRLFRSPGRTELGGNHTDHNQGIVLCASIQYESIACARKRNDNRVIIKSEGYDNLFNVDISILNKQNSDIGKTEALIRGVADGFLQKGWPIGGFEAVMTSDVLPGSGLSSSASVEILFGLIFSSLYSNGLVPWIELAKIGQYAENIHFGKPCGLEDQMACAAGGILNIDFADPLHPEWRNVNFDFSSTDYILAVVDTGGSHADLTKEYAAIPEEMKKVAEFFGKPSLRYIDQTMILANANGIRKKTGDRALLRALHFTDENIRVTKMVSALECDDFEQYLKLVQASGTSSREMLQNVTRTDTPGDQGLALGISLTQRFLDGKGAVRVHGGGFAGTMQAYIPAERMESWKILMENVFGTNCVKILEITQQGAAELSLI